MYNSLLDTFLCVIECGSFTKAAQVLFLSPTAIMKQMNTLEKQLQLQLIERTPSGVTLTKAGDMIYQDAKFMIDYAQKSLQQASSVAQSDDAFFCIGTSLLNPAKPFMDLWYRMNDHFPHHKVHLVPFDDQHDGIIREIKQLGKKFDFLIGVCDSQAWLEHCQFLLLGKYKKIVAVAREHPLAQKKLLHIKDLEGETLMMVPMHDSMLNDYIRNDLQRNYPKIKIEDTPRFYDLSVFNQCAESNRVLLSIECWQNVHPALVSIPVAWDYEIPYGILYAKDASETVRHFIQTCKKML